MPEISRPAALDRSAFDDIYNRFVIKAGFFEEESYYEIDRERYWKTLGFLHKEGLTAKRRVIEFGGGQMAIILNKLYGIDAVVADISADFRASVDKADVAFTVGNINDAMPVDASLGSFDLVLLLEVIEHIHTPPYVALANLRNIMSADGTLFLTTPNLFRLRNIIRMLRGRDIFDRFMLPQPGAGLGHQMEYSGEHMRWQLEQAGYAVRSVHHDQLGQIGHSRGARMARRVLSPLLLNPKWREELVVTADNRP